ncbi:hypothetical protein [Peribacillus sp. NPDC058075]|uniref:hypothetical protein n=1 Tax=unclassified Peribacillus TaxID=2675266 RepID=UPI0036DBFE20
MLNMKIYVGKTKNRWNSFAVGIIVGIGNDQYYIVRFRDGRKTWILKDWIFFVLVLESSLPEVFLVYSKI